MTDTGMPTAEDAANMMPQAPAAQPEASPERVAADATAKVFVTTIAEGVIQALVNIMQQKEGGLTKEDLTAVYCLAALYGVDVEEEKSSDKEAVEGLDIQESDQLFDENGNPLHCEPATAEELEAAFAEAEEEG